MISSVCAAVAAAFLAASPASAAPAHPDVKVFKHLCAHSGHKLCLATTGRNDSLMRGKSNEPLAKGQQWDEINKGTVAANGHLFTGKVKHLNRDLKGSAEVWIQGDIVIPGGGCNSYNGSKLRYRNCSDAGALWVRHGRVLISVRATNQAGALRELTSPAHSGGRVTLHNFQGANSQWAQSSS